MILDRIAPHLADPNQSFSANDFSRRRFLQAGAAAGGGLMLSLSLPFANSEAEVTEAGSFAPNAFIRILRKLTTRRAAGSAEDGFAAKSARPITTSAVSRQPGGTRFPSRGRSPARRSKFRNIELVPLPANCPSEPSEKNTISVGGSV